MNLKSFLFILIFTSQGAFSALKEPLFKMGLMADCQYAVKTSIKRKYSKSLRKLSDAVGQINGKNVDLSFHLGDFIDKDFDNFQKLIPITNRLNSPLYHVLGNHDFSVEDHLKESVPATLGLKNRYYSLRRDGIRLIVLDSNDISLYAYPKEHPEYLESLKMYQTLYAKRPDWNGGIGKKQLAWIKQELKEAAETAEKVILFAHHPIYPPSKKHNLWNDDKLLKVLSTSDQVVAFINGHNHDGNYKVYKGIHFLTLKGMVDTRKNSFAVGEVYNDSLVIKGMGREKSRVLKFK